MQPRAVLLALAVAAVTATPAAAFDLNSFRAQHHLPPLKRSGALSSAAWSHARDMAQRGHLDHYGFRQRLRMSSAGAENVAYGCADATCAFRMWSRSDGHRRNMLMRGVTHYGLGSAVASNGRRYWVLELGN